MSDVNDTTTPALETETVEVETPTETVEVEVPAEETPADETPAPEADVTEPAKPAKPPVLDGREEGKQVAIELGMRVKLLGEKDRDDEGKQLFGTVTGLEYQRQRAVIKVDGIDKLAVRPASKLMVKKSKSGKIERVERAVRGAKAKVAEAVQDAAPEVAPAE